MVSFMRAIVLGAAVPILLLAGPALAQQAPSGGLERTTPPPAPPEFGLEPTMPPDQQGSRDDEFYPTDPPRSRHEPAFLKPFVAEKPVSRTSSMRFGLSGWTAPALPFDSMRGSGGAAFGLTILWGAPPVEAKPAEPAPTGDR
jgi:hypothetical protein